MRSDLDHLDIRRIVMAAALVMLIQAGFGLLESGQIAFQHNQVLRRMHRDAQDFPLAIVEAKQVNKDRWDLRDEAAVASSRLKKKVAEPDRFEMLSIGRETRAGELKAQVNRFVVQDNKPPPNPDLPSSGDLPDIQARRANGVGEKV